MKRACRHVLVALWAAAAGCNGSSPPPPLVPEEPGEDPEEPVPAFGLGDTRVTFGGSGFPLDPAAASPVSIERAFENLGFNLPLLVTAAPDGTDRVFVVEKGGTISVLPNDDAVTTKTTFLDLGSKVSTGQEDGALGLVFDPDYASNGFFYVHYSPSSSMSRISRYKVSGNPDQADASSEVVLLEVTQQSESHNGGTLAFGADGMLYMSFGDGGNSDRSQDKTSLLGKVLRVDPHGGTPYSIPSDNPFAGQGGGVRGEIWALGFRNPWRFGFDRDTGDLWLGDVGGTVHEEIDLVQKGGNYAWPVYEGTSSLDNPQNLPFSNFKPPVHEFGRGCVIGGYVYRGNGIPGFYGAYVYGDHNTGDVYALRSDGTQVTSNQKIGKVGLVTSFGEDRDGELLITDFSKIYRIKGGGAGGGDLLPTKLSATGLFSNTLSLTPVQGLVEYDVNAELWSDGAEKRRWIGLPGSTRIRFDAEGNWDFPLGTVMVKHFELRVSPTSRTRLETRVLVRESAGWAGYTYRWNFLQTDAVLLADEESQAYTIEDAAAPGGTRQQVWKFPSRAQCMQCHTSAAGFVLGLRTRQINRDFVYPAATDNQLRAWNHVGLFDTDIGDAGDYGTMPDPRDETAPIAARARAYIEANCAQCHRAGSTTPGGLDLRYQAPPEDMNVIDVAPTSGDLGLAGARRVKPGVKESSVFWERMRRLDGTRMPPLGSGLVDAEALALIGEWIDGGP